MLQPVILCGGSGTRLWPLSRDSYPKQFLSLFDESSLLQNTVRHLAELDCSAPLVVSNENHRFLVAEQLRQAGLRPGSILLEPVGRNTAPAVAVAALQLAQQGDDPVLLVMPSDHLIQGLPAFHAAIRQAELLAGQGRLVTFGVLPAAPETGYGYILRGKPLDGGGHEVGRFVEKPSLEVARQYLADGNYFWNAGIFVFRASVFLQELERHNPAMVEACRAAVANAVKDMDFIRLEVDAFASSPSDSIDYAVMEKTDRAAVVPLDAGWSDVGSYASMWEVSTRDEKDNVVHGDVVLENSTACYVRSTGRLVTVLGMKQAVVVETADAVLVAAMDAVQDIKKIVGALKKSGRSEADVHRRVYRPWGYYEGVCAGERYQIKRIVVSPGASLSLQMHYHRAEHWVVVNGTAEVTCEDKTLLVSENQSTFIPLGHKHRLHNPGKTELEMIEVQSGGYLGEDDIVRFEDVYGRAR